MKLLRFASLAVALACAVALGACSYHVAMYAQSTLDDASGIKVVAENAAPDSTCTTGAAITVEEGDVIVVSPFTEKGSFHLTITPTGDGDPIFDEDVSGKVLFTVDAEPGSYDVTTSGDGVTGWMTVFAQDSAELAAQNASLIEKLERTDADPEADPDVEADAETLSPGGQSK